MKTFWQHTNGLVYVVESDSFGTITGAAGPLDIGNLRDPSEYPCAQGILTWVKHAIIDRHLRRINPKVGKEPAPPPAAQRTGSAASAPPPCQKVLAVKGRQPPEPPPDNKQQEIRNRQRFDWSTSYRL